MRWELDNLGYSENVNFYIFLVFIDWDINNMNNFEIKF